MIKTFESKEDYETWLGEETLPSGIIAYIKSIGDIYLTTNNIDGTVKTYHANGKLI